MLPSSPPMNYTEPLFRPPSEWRSLILQITNGCSWNRCSFCEMYTAPQKAFRFKPLEQIETECQAIASTGVQPARIFLADGDAMTLSTRRLLNRLTIIRKYFPDVQRISSYCLPRNLKNKSVDDLLQLKKYGLLLLYVGCESGDDQVLSLVNKGETFDSSKQALSKIKSAGIRSSVMILNGLGGIQYSRQHALNSAKLMNDTQPDYLSTLVVSFPMGEERFRRSFPEFSPLSTRQLIEEMELFVRHLELDSTIFRSDHASNYLVLKGILNKDKSKILEKIRLALQAPNLVQLREEWQRGL